MFFKTGLVIASLLVQVAPAFAADESGVVTTPAPTEVHEHADKPPTIRPGVAAFAQLSVNFPYLAVNFALESGTVFGAGFTYNFDGSKPGPQQNTGGLMLYIHQAVINNSHWAQGPELTIFANLDGTPFTNTTLVPGWALIYKPWEAPLVLIGGLDVAITLPINGTPAAVATIVPSVRVGYVFAAL